MLEISALICWGLTWGMAILHLLLVWGAPLGKYVLGGKDKVIPKEKRYINLVLFVDFFIIGTVYLSKTRYLPVQTPVVLTKGIMVLYTMFLAYAIVANMFLTESKKEQMVMTPLPFIGCFTSMVTLMLS